jgi:hypothetical protein
LDAAQSPSIKIQRRYSAASAYDAGRQQQHVPHAAANIKDSHPGGNPRPAQQMVIEGIQNRGLKS